MRPADAIPDAPVYTATMAEMENLEELLATANELAMKYGAVRIDPPPAWAQPPLRMGPKSRFFVRMQTLPASPFADPEFVKQAQTLKHQPRKRSRRKAPIDLDHDSDEPIVVATDPKTASRDRAARAASRSQRNHQLRATPDHQTIADHIAEADFNAARAPPNPALGMAPNPTCTPATSPPPELLVPGPNTLVKMGEQPVLLPMGQTFARPILPRYILPRLPESQILPSGSSTRQPVAVQEAALRLEEAFTGFAKAGPAPNAPAIPPCPFSQQTAQEHMAKRTTGEDSRFPLVEAGPAPQSLPGAATNSVFRTNEIPSTVAYGREIADRSMRRAEVGHDRDGANTDHNDDGRSSLQISGAQDAIMSVRPAKEHVMNQQYLAATVKTSAEMMRSHTESPGTKNINSNDRANLTTALSPRLTATSSLAFYGPQLKTLPQSAKGLKRTDCSSTEGIIPATNKLGKSTCEKGYADKNLYDVARTTPFLSHPATMPATTRLVLSGTSDSKMTQKNSEGLHRPSTAVRAPAPEFEGRSAASGRRSTGFRPHFRSVPPPTHSVSVLPPKASQIAYITNPPTMSSAPNAVRVQGGQQMRHDGGPSPVARQDHSSFRSAPYHPNDPAFGSSGVVMRAGCGIVSPSNAALVKAPPAQLRNADEMDGRKQAPRVAKVESLISLPFQSKDEVKNALARRHSTTIKLPTDEGENEKGSREPVQRFSDSCHRSAPHPALGSEIRVGRSKQTVPVAGTAISLQNMSGQEDAARSSLSCSLGGNRVLEFPTSRCPCTPELSLAEQSKILPSGPAQQPRREETTRPPGYREPSGLPTVMPKVSNDAAREIMEEILAVATGGADITSVKPPPAKTYQEQTTNHDIHAPHDEASNIVVPCHDSIQGASQKEHLSFDRQMADAFLDKSLMWKQDEATSLVPQPGQPTSFRQQQPAHPSQLNERSVNAEEVVVVAERRLSRGRERESRKEAKPIPIINVDADAPVTKSKDRSSAANPPAKRNPKRKMENRYLHFEQDGVGRLTKAIVFPDSGTPISLAAYEKKAQQHHEEAKIALSPSKEEKDGTDIIETGHLISKTDMHDVDTLEVEFWKAMTAGIRGNPITVAYGVDVEAEGAFDSSEMSYVEWYGADSAGLKPNKRKKGQSHKPKKPKLERRPRQSTGNILDKPANHALGTCAEEPHDDADDEMEYEGDKVPTARERMRHEKKGRLGPPKSMYQRDKSTGPRSHVGTLNRDGLLRHLPRMPGINHSMYYVGQLFTRFCWHTEDAFLNSVSYLHPGSAEKVWYAVPPRDALAFEEYAASNVFSPDLLEDESSGQVLLMNKTTMFDPRGVRRKGVSVYRVVHKPGSLVLTAPRAYHAGFNCGFNIAEAVNFANPTWFPVGREASSFARRAFKPLCVPWEYLLFHEAKAMHDMSHGATTRATSKKRLVYNARVVAKELKAIITEGEMKIRKYAEARNCRVSMLHSVDGLAKNNQVGPEFGHGAGLVCSLCAHTCHFYAEMCGSCADSFEARCVDHFGEGHRLCLQQGHNTVIVRRHNPVLLLDILGCLEEMGEMEVDRSEQARRYLGYLRSWQTPLRSSGLRMRLDLKAAVSRLPPKVSKEKGHREKTVRDKTNRDKRRKIRKPHGMFSNVAKGSKHGSLLHAVECLADDDLTSSMGRKHEKSIDEELILDGVIEVKNKVPVLR